MTKSFIIPDCELNDLLCWSPTGHVVCDIETVDTQPTAAIASVGLVPIYRSNFTDDIPRFAIPSTARSFYTRVNAAEQIESGRTMSQATMRWWHTVSPEAYGELEKSLMGCTVSTKEVATKIADYLESYSTMANTDLVVWGNGPTFDNVLLNNLFQQYGVKTPWGFRGEGCLRTVRRLFGKNLKRNTPIIPHHALYDAHAEALDLVQAENLLPDTLSFFS